MQDKITDLEVRFLGYLHQLLNWSYLKESTYRALTQKLRPGGNLRSTVVSFLQFETKEMKATRKLVRRRWETRIQFDHDCPMEIVQKHSSYLGIKKPLKEKGIRFHTSFTKIWIHWNSGVKSYDKTREAAQHMKARGFAVEILNKDAERMEGWICGALVWKRVKGSNPNQDMAQWARERLQDYQRRC